MPYRELFFFWVGGAVSWLYLVHFAVQMAGGPRPEFSFGVGILMSLAWPITIPFSILHSLWKRRH